MTGNGVMSEEAFRASLHRHYREACRAFLFACFNGAVGAHLRELAEEVYSAREALWVMHRSVP